MEEFVMSEIYQGQAEMESMFPGVSKERALNLIKSMERLIPLGTKDRLWYLEVLIKYVDGLINGDDIIQYSTSKYMTPMAKDSMEEVLSEVQERVLSSYRDERSELRSEVETLSSQRKLLEENIERLLSRKDELFGQTTSLGEEVTRLNREYTTLRNNGIQKIEAEFKERRESLELEVAKLKDEKNFLSKSINELKGLLDRYSSITSELSKPKGKCEVTWELIGDKHPIYKINYSSIEAFVKSLKLEYMDNLGVSEEVCEREFAKNAPGLEEIMRSTLNFQYYNSAYVSSIGITINPDYYNRFTEKDKMVVMKLRSLLSSLRLPKYKILHENIDSVSVNRNTLPSNIQSMMRELHFQRIALEAVSKQKILEAELETVLGVLQSLAPKNYDFTSMEDRMRSLEDKLNDNNKLTL